MKIFLLLLVLGITALFYHRWIVSSRRRFLASYAVPGAVVERFRKKHADLDDLQIERVHQGLLQYFNICAVARGKFVSMPSQVVDDLWHEFILFTRNYERFCASAFGRYLHHTPVEAMAAPDQATEGIRRTWRLACRMEKINPKQPDRLPLLFSLDGQLAIPAGFIYSLNCKDTAASSANSFCASHIGGCGSGSSCGSGSDAASSDGGSGDSGSSCGGGGCGGGGD